MSDIGNPDALAPGHYGVPGPTVLTLRPTTIAVAWNLQGNPERGGFAAEAAAWLGVALPLAPNTTATTPHLSVLWLGPASWLALAGAAPGPSHPLADFAATRSALNAAGGAVFDVSVSRVAWTLEGAPAASVLASGCPLDLNRRAFPSGTCAQSVFGHVGALYHRPREDAFTIFVARSFAADVGATLAAAAAQFGFDLLPGAPFGAA